MFKFLSRVFGFRKNEAPAGREAMSWFGVGSFQRSLWRQRRMGVPSPLTFLCLFVALPNLSGQSLPLPPWEVLAEESPAVVVGHVDEDQLWVIDPVKKAKAEITPDGKPTLPNPDAYLLGILGRVRISEIIKGGASLRVGDTIGVLTYGYVANDKPDPVLRGKKYLLFLRPLQTDNKDFRGAVVERYGPPGSVATRTKFDPKGCYTPVRGGFGQVILRPDRMRVLEDIKQGIAKRP
jgi:hypothetical protein